jgi:hypothetical protein
MLTQLCRIVCQFELLVVLRIIFGGAQEGGKEHCTLSLWSAKSGQKDLMWELEWTRWHVPEVLIPNK